VGPNAPAVTTKHYRYIYIRRYYLSHSMIDLLVHQLDPMVQLINQLNSSSNQSNQSNSPPSQPNLYYITTLQSLCYSNSVIFSIMPQLFFKFYHIFFEISSRTTVTQSFLLQCLSHFYHSDSVIFRFRQLFLRFHHVLQ
jgi:hypothetical protein